MAALVEHGNTLGIAPTGAGKTVMLSHIAGRMPAKNGLVIQHRDELVGQNRRTFAKCNPAIETDLYTAERKRPLKRGWTFGMIQTLVRNLERLPPFEAVIVDEAHHSVASSYMKTIDKLRALVPEIKIFGVTATPGRGDKKGLRSVFDNCADQISLKELIDTGFLVKPRGKVIDLGVRDALSGVRRKADDFDMEAVAAIMDKQVLNDKIVEKWAELARDRLTIVFASNVDHAIHVAEAFNAHGVRAGVIHGELSDAERKRILAAHDGGDIQVLVNVGVLVEGYDSQPVSCVVLLRPCSYKSTMIQMVGRGLRKVDPALYPGVIKDDCLILDFGTSLLTHGDIEQGGDLHGEGSKECPGCFSTIPAQSNPCPICNYEFPKGEAPTKRCEACGHPNFVSVKICIECGEPFPEKDEKGIITDFAMTEIDLLELSPFRWESIFEGGVMIADGFDAFAVVVSYYGHFYAIGAMAKRAATDGGPPNLAQLLGVAPDRLAALATADDFLREHGSRDAGKAKSWLNQAASDRQCQLLGIDPMNAIGINRYKASCYLSWRFNEKRIRAILERYDRAVKPPVRLAV